MWHCKIFSHALFSSLNYLVGGGVVVFSLGVHNAEFQYIELLKVFNTVVYIFACVNRLSITLTARQLTAVKEILTSGD